LSWEKNHYLEEERSTHREKEEKKRVRGKRELMRVEKLLVVSVEKYDHNL